MAAKQSVATVADFPAELITAVLADAARDADRVGQFLIALGLRLDPKTPLPLPERFLLQLGAALRLLSWEAEGLFSHRAVGLPDAGEAIREAFQSLHDPDAGPSELCMAVLRLFVERFAWHGRRDLDADVTLDDLTDDAALGALAEYLWTTRHTGTETASP
jgi:hypothetical protein